MKREQFIAAREERWKEFDSRVRRELRKIRKVETATGMSRDQLHVAARSSHQVLVCMLLRKRSKSWSCF